MPTPALEILITMDGPIGLFADSTMAEPMIGPVQENETIAKVNAIKNMPINPPLSAI